MTRSNLRKLNLLHGLDGLDGEDTFDQEFEAPSDGKGGDRRVPWRHHLACQLVTLFCSPYASRILCCVSTE